MSFDLDTETGMRNAVEWTRNLFSLMKNGGRWFVPRSGIIVTVDHRAKTAYLSTGDAPDPSIERVIAAMGWKVVHFNR